MNYTVYNTNYRFNLINNIVGTTLANQNVPIFNDTRMARTQLTAPVNNSGIFDLILDASVSLPPLMTQLIQLRVAALVNQYGNATQAWGSSPPYGVTIENLAPGVDTNGNPTSGGKVMIVAYCDKYFYIPIQEVTDQRPVIFTGTVSVNGGTPVGPASNAFFSPYASMLPNVGMRFVDYWNTTTNMLFSANHDEIGIGEPYKLGFIYSNFFDPDYDYVLNNVPSQNPYLNARYFKKWADQYSSTITGTPDPGSCDRLCGSLLTQTQVRRRSYFFSFFSFFPVRKKNNVYLLGDSGPEPIPRPARVPPELQRHRGKQHRAVAPEDQQHLAPVRLRLCLPHPEYGNPLRVQGLHSQHQRPRSADRQLRPPVGDVRQRDGADHRPSWYAGPCHRKIDAVLITHNYDFITHNYNFFQNFFS